MTNLRSTSRREPPQVQTQPRLSRPRTATVVAEVQWLLGIAKVYRLSDPIPWREVGDDEQRGVTEHIVVSAVPTTPLGPGGPEAMAWASDADGNFLAGEERGEPVSVAREHRHDAAVEALGFEVVPGDDPVRRIGGLRAWEPPTREDMEAFNADLEAEQERARKAFLRLNPKPALEALRLAEPALAIQASLRAPEQARVNQALEKVRETLAMYREAGA